MLASCKSLLFSSSLELRSERLFVEEVTFSLRFCILSDNDSAFFTKLLTAPATKDSATKTNPIIGIEACIAVFAETTPAA